MEQRDLTGHVLDGRYRVLAPVGAGAMGSVYRAEHLKLGRVVAVKVIGAHLPNDEASRRRFEREALAMAKLEHPHCASVLDVGMHDDQPFVVMDFVSGQNLKDLIDRGPLPIPRAVEITRQILSGLAHAHEHGVIHRDIKPANIVLSQKAGLGDHAKILDFGLAKLDQESSDLTRGMVVGTPSYMAPEQIRGQLLDARVDLYACGVLLFELLTGKKPFRSENNAPLEICTLHLNAPVPRLADVRPGHEFGALEAVVARALAKDRDQRFASATEFAHALVTAAEPWTTRTPPAGTAIPSVATVELPASSLETASVAPPAVAPAGMSPAAAARAGTAPTEHLSRADLASSSQRPAPRSRWLGFGLVIGVLAVGGVVTAAVLGDRGSTAEPAPIAGSPPVAPDAPLAIAPTPSPVDDGEIEDPVADLVARARDLATSGRREPALDLLLKARRTYPQDPRLPYEAGLLYLGKMWWADGLAQLRAAIELDPQYRSDPELIKAVVLGFNTTARPDWRLAGFLRKDIGAAARPYLEDTAKGHPNPKIRKRAAAELRHYR